MVDIVVIHERRADLPMMLKPEHLEWMREAAGGGRVSFAKNEKEALEAGVDGEVLFTWCGSGPMPVEYCRKSEKLKWIHSFSAGVNPIMQSPIAHMPVTLTNAKGLHGKTMSVTTMGYIISFLRALPEYARRQRAHVWDKNGPLLREPTDMTLGIVGAGAIGSDVARLAKALNMRVLGVKHTVTPLDNYDEVYPNSRLDAVLAQSDFVVILTPLTDETYHLIDRERLSCMKPTAYLINIARGPVVDTAALTEALEKGVIAGAALDAMDPEPLGADSKLWDMENVIITPHCAADSDRYMDRAVKQFCENVVRYRRGEPLINRIDLTKAY